MSSRRLGPSWWPAAVPVRYLVTGLLFSGLLCGYALRTMLSIIMTPMASEFGYSVGDKGLVLGSFFVGYLAVQPAGGVWAQRWGGLRVLGASVGVSGLCALATPLFAGRLWSLVVLRAATGLAQGALYSSLSPPRRVACGGCDAPRRVSCGRTGTAPPFFVLSLVFAARPSPPRAGPIYSSIHALVGRWAPAHERSAIIGVAWSGAYIGTVLALPVAGRMVEPDGAGWAAVFVLFGALAVDRKSVV